MSGVRVPLRPLREALAEVAGDKSNSRTWIGSCGVRSVGARLFTDWEVRPVKSTQRHAAIAASVFALALAGIPAVLPAQQQQPQQRGGPPKQDTPKILIATFRSDDRLLGVQASDAVRRRT